MAYIKSHKYSGLKYIVPFFYTDFVNFPTKDGFATNQNSSWWDKKQCPANGLQSTGGSFHSDPGIIFDIFPFNDSFDS